jgi:hypothetical protein
MRVHTYKHSPPHLDLLVPLVQQLLRLLIAAKRASEQHLTAAFEQLVLNEYGVSGDDLIST